MKNKTLIELTYESSIVEYFQKNFEDITNSFEDVIVETIDRRIHFRGKSEERFNKRYKARPYKYKGEIKYTSDERQANRLAIGYNGLGKHSFTPARCNFFSEGALSLPTQNQELVTQDHSLGVSTCGDIVFELLMKLYEDENKSKKEVVEYMTQEWLKDNLHNWVQVQITKEEDRRLLRNCHTLEEKINLKQYTDADIIIGHKK